MQNSKVHAKWCIMPFALLLVLFISCKKGDIQKSNSDKLTTHSDLFITSAENFFNKNVAGTNPQSGGNNSWENRKKKALWDKAYIAKYPKKDIIVVPIDFEEGASVSAGITGDKKLSLKKQSNLILFKNDKDNFQAEVYTSIPEKDYEQNPVGRFNGVIIIDDWAGKNKGNFIFKDGKYKKLQSKPTTNAGMQTDVGGERIECYFINYYLCDVEFDGSYSNCEYTGSVPLGCYNSFGDETLWVDPGTIGDGSVTYYPIDEVEATKFQSWEVYTQTVSGPPPLLKASIILWGKKNSSYPQGGYFTNSSDKEFWTENFSNYSMGFFSTTNESWYGPQHAYHRLAGNITYPSGGPQPKEVDKTKTWDFSEVFP